MLDDLAHEIWSVAQLLPNEGIEDGVERIKNIIAEALKPSHNITRTKLRKIIIELGCRGVIGASERDTAIVDEICKREGIVL